MYFTTILKVLGCKKASEKQGKGMNDPKLTGFLLYIHKFDSLCILLMVKVKKPGFTNGFLLQLDSPPVKSGDSLWKLS